MTLVGKLKDDDYCVIIYNYEQEVIVESLKNYYFKVINDPATSYLIKNILDDLGGLR